MSIYKTAAQWGTYFGGNTADQHKILVDILDACEAAQSSGTGNIDGTLIYEVINPANTDAVNTTIQDGIDFLKTQGKSIVNVQHSVSYNGSGQKCYNGIISFSNNNGNSIATIDFDTVIAQQSYTNSALVGAEIAGVWFGSFRVTNYTFDEATGTITFDDTVDDVVNVLVILK